MLAEHCAEYFALDCESPFMSLAAQVRPARRSVLPAVTHVDGSARIETVREAQNPRFYHLIRAFARLTGVPVVLNTSFNVRDEPIVCTPAEAVRCFLRTGMDALVLGNHLVHKVRRAPVSDAESSLAVRH